MKEISIFLASSSKLSEERTEIERLIARMNNLIHKGIYLKLRIWEKLSSTFETGRKQNKFNDEVLKSNLSFSNRTIRINLLTVLFTLT